MRSVADDLRRDTVARVRAMSMAERIRLALSLGDADLDQYVRARSLADDVDADLAALPETMRQRWLAARKR